MNVRWGCRSPIQERRSTLRVSLLIYTKSNGWWLYNSKNILTYPTLPLDHTQFEKASLEYCEDIEFDPTTKLLSFKLKTPSGDDYRPLYLTIYRSDVSYMYFHSDKIDDWYDYQDNYKKHNAKITKGKIWILVKRSKKIRIGTSYDI